MLQLCKQMKYENVQAGNYIFQEGDLSNNKLYIVLSGRVNIIFQKDRNVFFEENLKHEAADNLESQKTMDGSKNESVSIESVSPAFKKVRAMVKSVVKFSLLSSNPIENSSQDTLAASPLLLSGSPS